MRVVADVQRHVIAIDGITHGPVPTSVSVTEVGLAFKLSVRYIHQAIRDGNADLHALDLVAPLVLVRKPDARSIIFARGIDPRVAFGVLSKNHSTKTSDRQRMPGIIEID